MDRIVSGYVFRESLEEFSQGRLTKPFLEVYDKSILGFQAVGEALRRGELVLVQITFIVEEAKTTEEQAATG